MRIKTMSNQLTKTSQERLKTVDVKLSSIILAAIEQFNMNVQIAEGARSLEQQKENVKKGVSQTLKSKHIDTDLSDGLNVKAVDVAIIKSNGKYSGDLKDYKNFADVVKKIAKEKNVKIVWGGDWKSLVDGPHFELA